MSYDLCAFAGHLKTQPSSANQMPLFRKTDYQLVVMGNAFFFFPGNRLAKKNHSSFPGSPAFAEL